LSIGELQAPRFDTNGHGLGTGFVNMKDRLGALRGSLRVESARGQGTRVTGTVPLAWRPMTA